MEPPSDTHGGVILSVDVGLRSSGVAGDVVAAVLAELASRSGAGVMLIQVSLPATTVPLAS